MKKQEQDEQVRRAKAALTRVEQQSEKILGAGSSRSDDNETDPIDYWGKRIGRVIGYIIVIILIWQLSTTYFFK